MAVTTKRFAGAVLAASAAVLGAALLSQYWGGLTPCELCLLERAPWWVAIGIAVATLLFARQLALPSGAMLLALVFLASTALGFYHVGVEQHWFAGPAACTASGAPAASVDALRAQLHGKQAVMCDEVQWSLFGVSLAGWNMIASAVMAAACIEAARRSRRVRFA
ncbi:MAG TPA: disulfide bond formation protein B [Stellaceae bacterium]|nr:disulfide bond formation protein B [Stellaceae bacterium]